MTTGAVLADGFGYRPGPLDLSRLREATRSYAADLPRKSLASPLPSRWDSRERGWVTSVKDQGGYGSCWAFATMACLETSLLKDSVVTNDFSENHLANHDIGFLWDFNAGGNHQMATALLTSWRDPIDETDDPYPHPGVKVTKPPRCHVQDVVWLPARGDSGDNGMLKDAVRDYGAVMVAYYHSEGYMKKATGGYYCPYSTLANHAVTLVGWDDAYSAENFKEAPPGDGAFLIKNSWGESSGTNGYTWISYYDATLGYDESAAFATPEGTNNFGRVYEYDPCGAVFTYGYGTGASAWCANVFTAASTGVVEAVGCYSLCPGTSYRIEVYVGCRSENPRSGTLGASVEGTFATAGFKTVRLPEGVPLSALGQTFSVVARFSCAYNDNPIACHGSLDGYCVCSAVRGRSFISGTGKSWDWDDACDLDPTASVCLKAYTKYLDTARGRAAVTVSVEAPEGTVVTTVPAPGEYEFLVGDRAAFSADAYAYATNSSGMACRRYPLVGSVSNEFAVAGATNVVWRYEDVPSECRLRTFYWFDEYFLYAGGDYYDTFIDGDDWLPFGTNLSFRLPEDAPLGEEFAWSGYYKTDPSSWRSSRGTFDFKLYGIELSVLGEYGPAVWDADNHYAMPTNVSVTLANGLDICWYYTPDDDYFPGNSVPYWWLMRNLGGAYDAGLIAFDEFSESADPDGDGFANLAEFADNKGPFDDMSFPFAFTGIDFEALRFVGSLKGGFEVLGSADLVTWTNYWSVAASERTSVTNVVPLDASSSNGFFKVRYLPPVISEVQNP